MRKSLKNDVLSVLKGLDLSQWWAAERLRAHQSAALSAVLRHAIQTVPFYRERFGETGFSLQDAGIECLRDLPLLSRQEVQLAGDRLHSTRPPREHGNPFPMFTGGSTARPVMVLGTALTEVWWRATTIRDHLWHRRDFSQKLAVIRYTTDGAAAAPHGQTLGNWGLATDGLVETGPCYLLNVASTTAEQAGFLKQHQPPYLLTYPSVLSALATFFIRSRDNLECLHQVRTFGEVLEPQTRELCRRAWGVSVVDNYSSQEVGYIALQCPVCENYHAQPENLIVEVIDNDGRPCAPGEVGKVVVTTLHNYAMPLIRYDIGDYAEVGEPCPCGRGLPVLNRILGRQRNMFVLPSGELRWPAFELDPTQAFAGTLPISQFQVIQRTRNLIDVNLVAFRRLTEAEENRLRSHVDAWLGYPFDVTFVYVAEIPRSPTGKFEDFRCEVAHDDATL